MIFTNTCFINCRNCQFIRMEGGGGGYFKKPVDKIACVYESGYVRQWSYAGWGIPPE